MNEPRAGRPALVASEVGAIHVWLLALFGALAACADDPMAVPTHLSEPSPTVSLLLSPASIQQNDGVSIVTATLDRPATDWITVTVSATPAPPAVASDFRLSENRTLTFLPGKTTSRGVVTITGAVSGEDEPNRRVTVIARPEAPGVAVTAGQPMTLALANIPDVCSESSALDFDRSFLYRDDCNALLAAKDGLRGTAMLNWDTALAMPEWDGVTLGTLGVEKVALPFYELDGTIPPEVGELDNLLVLHLARNGLTGEIPPELGSMAKLENLVLWGNDLEGEIPPELGRLARLEELSLSSNELTGEIPPELGGLERLKTLYFYNNDLEGEIPPQLGRLQSLQYLELTRNRFVGEIPSELGNLRSLRDLLLRENQLTGAIPPELGRLANLEYLSLRDNQLTESIPPELGDATELKWVDLDGNQLTGGIPKELGSLEHLISLRLSHNRLEGTIPPELGGSSQLGYLHFDDNPGLTGPIPMTFVENHLWRFHWFDTGLCSPSVPWFQAWLGSIEDHEGGDVCGDGDFEAFSGLRINNDGSVRLQVGGITLSAGRTGCISGGGTLNGKVYDYHWSAWQRNTGSGWNDVSGTKTEGRLCGYDLTSVPDGKYRLVGDWTLAGVRGKYKSENEVTVGGGGNSDRAALVALYEATNGRNWVNNDNWLSDAPLRDWYGVETDAGGQVTRLDLRGLRNPDTGEPVPHGLAGPIPSELGNLSELRVLFLSRNALKGSIPPALGKMAILDSLTLGGNQLDGPIPSELGNLDGLLGLWLWGNNLTGEIPRELGNLTSLESLSLGNNALTGEIPSELGNLDGLLTLGLWHNNLTGEIPRELGNLTSLESLSLSNNALTGEIPSELGNLDGLLGLWLWQNNLTGEIPRELGNLTSLENLLLFNNALTGEIPRELGNLTSLENLLLTNNVLAGEIPRELGNLTSLESLDLTHNALTGEIPRELRNLTSLESLSLGNNALTGEIPSELGNLDGLLTLGLWHNNLTGEIPRELRNLTSLENLLLFNNALTGEIPRELGNLTSLEQLSLHRNRLTGVISDDFLKLGNLETLRFEDNDGLCAPSTHAFTGWLNGIGTWSGPRCSGSNQTPVTVGTISAKTVKAGESVSVSVNASSYFSDPDRDALTYTASSSRTSVAATSVSGRTVTVNGVAEGSATIRITATDPGGLSAFQTFSVTVEAGGDDFEAFTGLKINNDGSVRLQVGGITLSAGKTGCISGGGTLNGRVYDYHWTAWQRNTGSGWTEVSGSRQTGKLCGYDLTSAPSGKYRLVGDMTLAGVRGKYKSENEVTK